MAGVLEVWAAAEQGRTAQGHPQGHLSDFFICMLTFQIFPGISLGEEAIQGSILTAHTRGGDEYLLGLLGPRCTLPSKHAAERASVCSGGARRTNRLLAPSWRGMLPRYRHPSPQAHRCWRLDHLSLLVPAFCRLSRRMLSSRLRATTVAPFRQGLRESGHTAIELSVRPDAAPVGRTPKLTCGCHGAASRPA